MTFRLLVVLAAVALPLAGCVATKDPPPVQPAKAAPTPTPGGTPPASTAAAPDAPASAAPRAPHTKAYKATASVLAEVGHPCTDASLACSTGVSKTFGKFTTDEAAPSTVTLVATWSATVPTASTLSIYLYPKSGKFLAEKKGASPLTIDVPADALKAPGDYVLRAYPDVPGVAVQQDVAFDIKLDYK